MHAKQSGAKVVGKYVGGLSEFGVFSFDFGKMITTGEGGMVTTNNDKLATKIRCLRDHGALISDRQRHLGPRPYLLADHPEAGYNQRMTDLQATLGSAQMDRAQEIISERRSLAKNYDNSFQDLGWLQTPINLAGYQHGYQSYPCLFQPEKSVNAAKTKNIKEN